MRFIVMVMGDSSSEAGVMPTEDMLREMGNYNEELARAGVMLAGEGLHPTSKGFKVRFDGDKRTIVDGPFTEAKEIVAGFWIWQVKSREEAVEWIKRSPFREGEVQIRQIFEADDFGDEFTPELREQEDRIRAMAESSAEKK